MKSVTHRLALSYHRCPGWTVLLASKEPKAESYQARAVRGGTGNAACILTPEISVDACILYRWHTENPSCRYRTRRTRCSHSGQKLWVKTSPHFCRYLIRTSLLYSSSHQITLGSLCLCPTSTRAGITTATLPAEAVSCEKDGVTTGVRIITMIMMCSSFPVAKTIATLAKRCSSIGFRIRNDEVSLSSVSHLFLNGRSNDGHQKFGRIEEINRQPRLV